jgi:hypothetical protein
MIPDTPACLHPPSQRTIGHPLDRRIPNRSGSPARLHRGAASSELLPVQPRRWPASKDAEHTPRARRGALSPHLSAASRSCTSSRHMRTTASDRCRHWHERLRSSFAQYMAWSACCRRSSTPRPAIQVQIQEGDFPVVSYPHALRRQGSFRRAWGLLRTHRCASGRITGERWSPRHEGAAARAPPDPPV